MVTIIESLRAFVPVYVMGGNNGTKPGLEPLSLLITNNILGESPRIGFGSAIAVVLLVISLIVIIPYLVQTFRKERVRRPTWPWPAPGGPTRNRPSPPAAAGASGRPGSCCTCSSC